MFQQRHYYAVADMLAELPETLTQEELVARFVTFFGADSAKFKAGFFEEYVGKRRAVRFSPDGRIAAARAALAGGE